MYRTPYPAAYDQLPLPHKYKLPDFTKFSGQGEVSTVEHINRFIVQCGEAAQHDALKVCLFFYVFVWIGLHMVHYIASQFHYILG